MFGPGTSVMLRRSGAFHACVAGPRDFDGFQHCELMVFDKLKHRRYNAVKGSDSVEARK
jgi:hypothetical protein